MTALRSTSSITSSLYLAWRRATPFWLGAVAVLIAPSPSWAEPSWNTMPFTLFREMQAVTAAGSAAWTIPTYGPGEEQGYKLRGVVLNNPVDLLDSTPNYIPCAPGTQWQLGGQWQIFVQAVDGSDFGGAALWMGQNYGNHIWHWPDSSYSYTNAEWQAELARLTTNNTLKVGDLVEVHARGGLFYQGKFNVNEQHEKDPSFDFDIEILQAGQMSPPSLISLLDVKNLDDSFKFVQDRQSGAEHYQSTLVKLKNVSLVSSAGWGPDATLTITDGAVHLPMKLGRVGFNSLPPPSGPFDVVGIFDQESPDYRGGYRLWVVDASQFAVPEPSSIVLIVAGVLSLLMLATRRRRLAKKEH